MRHTLCYMNVTHRLTSTVINHPKTNTQQSGSKLLGAESNNRGSLPIYRRHYGTPVCPEGTMYVSFEEPRFFSFLSNRISTISKNQSLNDEDLFFKYWSFCHCWRFYPKQLIKDRSMRNAAQKINFCGTETRNFEEWSSKNGNIFFFRERNTDWEALYFEECFAVY